MPPLNLPYYAAKISEKGGKRFIYDVVRQKYIALTPEEWVRQHFVNYLITELGFPPARIANEVSLVLNGTSKRCDTVVYDRYLDALMVVEYKAPSVEIGQPVFDQIVRYNMALRVNYLVVSNGINHYCCRIDYERGTYRFIDGIPEYTALEASL